MVQIVIPFIFSTTQHHLKFELKEICSKHKSHNKADNKKKSQRHTSNKGKNWGKWTTHLYNSAAFMARIHLSQHFSQIVFCIHESTNQC